MRTFNLLGLEDFEMKIDQIALKENGKDSDEIRSNKRSADDDWITNLYHHFNDPLSFRPVVYFTTLLSKNYTTLRW